MIYDELQKQKHCIDLMLNEDSVTKNRKSNGESAFKQKFQSIDDKIKGFESNISSITKSTNNQTVNITSWIESVKYRDEALNKTFHLITIEMNALKINQKSLLDRITDLETNSKNHLNECTHTTTRETVNEHNTHTVNHNSHLVKVDQSTQTLPNTDHVIDNPSTELSCTGINQKQYMSRTKYHSSMETETDTSSDKPTNTLRPDLSRDINNPRINSSCNNSTEQRNNPNIKKDSGRQTDNINNDTNEAIPTTKQHNNLDSNPHMGPEIRKTDKEISRNTDPQRIYRRKKCLFVHDSTISGFDQSKFSNEFDVRTYNSKSILFLSNDRKLKELIDKLKPECIFIHVGMQDIANNRKKKDIIRDFESIMWYLLEKTEANICFSSIIPTSNSDFLNRNINDINSSIEELVTEARAINYLHKSCLFTYNNNSVMYHNRSLPNGVHLSETGKLIMWRRLGDGFRKTLRLFRPQLSDRTIRQNSDHYG